MNCRRCHQPIVRDHLGSWVHLERFEDGNTYRAGHTALPEVPDPKVRRSSGAITHEGPDASRDWEDQWPA